MAKISNTTSYPFGIPTNDDYVIGTETATLDTKNYKLGDIAALYPTPPTPNLSAVLTAGNEADAPLIGFGKSSLLLKNAGVLQLQLNPQVGPGSPGAGDIIAAGDVTIGGFISLTGEFKKQRSRFWNRMETRFTTCISSKKILVWRPDRNWHSS